MGETSFQSTGLAATDSQAYARFQKRERCDLAILRHGSLDATQVVTDLVAADIEALGQLPETRYRGAFSLTRLQTEISTIRRDIVGWTLYGLGPYFHWALAEVAWTIEIRRSSIANVESLLNARLDPVGRALYERMFVLLRMGEPDELLGDLSSYLEDHHQDFLAHQTLGNMLFFRLGRERDALHHYEAAATTSIGRSRYHASYAYLHAAYIHYLCEEYQEAVRDARSAGEISPNLFEAFYQYAHYCALNGRDSEAIQNLTKAIAADRYFCIRIALEPDFESLRGEIGSLFETVRDHARRNARESLGRAERALQMADIAGCRQQDAYNYQILFKQYTTAESLFKRETYFDCLDAQEIAEQLCEQTFRVTRGVLEAHLKDLQGEIAAKKSELQKTQNAQSSDAAEMAREEEAQHKRAQQENHLFRNVFVVGFWIGWANVAICFYLDTYLKTVLTIFGITLGELGILWLFRWLLLRGRLERLRMSRQALYTQQERTIDSLRKRIDQAEKKQAEFAKILQDIQERRVA